jgi:4'-phosphopantetheinyl transferase
LRSTWPNRSSGVVEVYFAKTKDIINEYDRLKVLIDGNEKLKADNLHFEEDRHTTVLCHSLLRVMLSKKLNTDPSGIRILYKDNGKPRLEDDSLYFSISHTHDAFAFAISDGFEIGVDLEKNDRNIDFLSITRKFFSTAERAYILDSPSDSRNRFFLLWTRKEALLKALGTGIISNLAYTEVVGHGGILNNNSYEYITDDHSFYDHFIYSKKITKYYLSVAMPQKAKILMHHLNAEKVLTYI